jgi:hypothetical protein
VKFKGRDIWNYPVENSHVTYSQELHWRLVAKWSLITFDKFIELEGAEQSRLVAAYETSMQIDAVLTADAQRQAKRKNNKKR